MLYIYIDKGIGFTPEEYLHKITGYFVNVFEPEWFNDEFVRRAITGIDNVKVVGDGRTINLYSEIFGNISPCNLSGGCKSIILLHKTDVKIRGENMGNNCVKFLLEIAERKDIEISLAHCMDFPENFKAIITNNNVHIHSSLEFINWMIHSNELESRNLKAYEGFTAWGMD